MRLRGLPAGGVLVLATACALSGVVQGARRGDALLPPTVQPPSNTWLSSLDDGYKDAARTQRPMLVIYGAPWCAPCEALEKQTARPEIQSKLTGWTLVHLDVDKLEGAQKFTGSIPSLHLLTASGKPIASRAGYLSGEDLLAWLSESVPKAVNVDPALTSADTPDSAAVAHLVTQLSGADSAAREAAVTRLLPWPGAAASAVADAFAAGNLRTRLAAMDLLQGWKAPINGIDPWKPQTIDAAKVDAIRKWAASIKTPATQPATLDAAQVQSAEADLKALITATDPSQAGILSARLARLGASLMPIVTKRLETASTDRERERLTALRYRLVATQSLTLGWPGGIERLASSDLQTRHAAADQLAKRATADDMPLLLELFSDPDPLVREISLHGLQTVGGKEGTAALVKLLHDPVANVRAAVLKQLAETPTDETTDAVVAYVPGEKDPDLVVHAVRVFKAFGNAGAVNELIALLKHDSWRVRAEAIDALGDLSQAYNSQLSAGQKNDIAAAVTTRLDDPDAFVIGRAMAAMKSLGQEMSPETINAAIAKHPELALDLVKSLAQRAQQQRDLEASKSLREFCSSKDAAVRAAAVVGYAQASPRFCEQQVRGALHDPVEDVKTAGAQALFEVMNSDLPHNGMVTKPSFFGFGGGETRVDPATWLDDYRAGKGRPAWYSECLADLSALLKSKDPVQRSAAAFALLPLGHDDEALPIVIASAKASDEGRVAAAQGLPWLPWEKRLALYNALVAPDMSPQLAYALVEGMSTQRDRRAAQPLWQLLAGSPSASNFGVVENALRQLYMNDNSDDAGDANPEQSKGLKADALQQLNNGSDAQKSMALVLMMQPLASDATAEAKKILDAPAASAALKEDALRVMLLALPAAEAQQAAAAALGDASKPQLASLALQFLARGPSAIQYMRERVYLRSNSHEVLDEYPDSNRPPNLKAPQGVAPEALLPLLNGHTPQQAADAGYILCLMKKPEGLGPLQKYWEAEKGNDRYVSRLLTRAITALDDDSKTPILEQIYAGYEKSDDFEIRSFYWTVRSMHGPNILALRKKIRDAVGMQRLQ